MEVRKRSDLALMAHLRTVLGWSLALPQKDRDSINAQAQALLDLGETEMKAINNDQTLETDEPDYLTWRETILATLYSRQPHDTLEDSAKRRMIALARELPVYEWARADDGISMNLIQLSAWLAGDGS